MVSLEQIDHVTIAASELGKLTEPLERYGFDPAYGGVHSNEVTHMSQLGFEDGTYLELISTVEPGMESPVWQSFVAQDGGACGWAIVVDDIDEAADQFRDEGIDIDQPARYEREPDRGDRLEWTMAVPSQHIYPFLIHDRTDRRYRAKPGVGTVHTETKGIGRVVLGVEDLESTIDAFHALFDLGEPQRLRDTPAGLKISSYDNAPVTLVAPSEEGWLGERLDTFGPSPVGFLLRSADPDQSRVRFGIEGTSHWGDLEIGWIPVTDREGLDDLGLVL